MNDAVASHYADLIVSALSSKVPGSESTDGSYLTQRLITKQQALELVSVIEQIASEKTR